MPGPDKLPLDPIVEARRKWREHGWGDAADGMAAVASVMRAHQIVLARVQRVLRPEGLTFARYELLMLLVFSTRGTLPMSWASARLQVHPTSVTNAVDRLEVAGLVQRSPHPDDRRATLLRITIAGRRAADAATRALNAEVFTQPGLDAPDVGRLVDVLAQLRAGAGDFDS